MKFLEKDLEDIVMSLDDDQMIECGLEFLPFYEYKKYRQLKIGNYGISDIVFAKRVEGYDHRSLLDVWVIELKKEKISMSSFIQLNRYMAGVKSYLECRGINTRISGVLIGKEIDMSSDFCYVSIFSEIRFYDYSYNWDGIKFNERSNFVLIDEGFNKLKIENNEA